MLIGTAGHIDHGKTTLIRALTGVNTDRLPEEQRRGISIDLGFAYLPVEEGEVLGFIDVPGHEKFVPTMLAGAAGIDFALLVIAADDGPMPQTREHLDILKLLGVTRGAVALTKIDRATPEQRALAEGAIQQLLHGTPLADAPVFPVAAPQGEGIAALRDALRAATRDAQQPATEPYFRLAIDRSFSLSGAGTVVTGTVMAGAVRVGDTLRLQSLVPRGFSSVTKNNGQRHFEVRVRSLHANNRAAEQGRRGMRCAINLVGIGTALSHHDIERGDWLVSPALDQASTCLDLALQPLPGSEKLLRPGIELHLHHGAQHAMGKLVPLDKERGWFQLVSRTPLLACHGDRLIVRDASGRQTLAGARVLDPVGPARHRARPERLAQLTALAEANPAARLARLIDASPSGVVLADFVRAANAAPPPTDAVAVGGGLFAPTHAAALNRRLVDALAGYHERHPDELGLERERLRRIAMPRLDPRPFAAWLDRALTEGTLVRTGNAWHLPAHRVELSGSEQALAARVMPALRESRFEPPWVRDLAAGEGVDEAAMRALLRKLAAQGEVFQVVRDLFYHRAVVGELGTLVGELAEVGARALARAGAGADAERQPVKAAALRDVTGLGRKRAIQILEFFDRVGYTRRIGSGQQQAHALRGEPPVGRE